MQEIVSSVSGIIYKPTEENVNRCSSQARWFFLFYFFQENQEASYTILGSHRDMMWYGCESWPLLEDECQIYFGFVKNLFKKKKKYWGWEIILWLKSCMWLPWGWSSVLHVVPCRDPMMIHHQYWSLITIRYDPNTFPLSKNFTTFHQAFVIFTSYSQFQLSRASAAPYLSQTLTRAQALCPLTHLCPQPLLIQLISAHVSHWQAGLVRRHFQAQSVRFHKC